MPKKNNKVGEKYTTTEGYLVEIIQHYRWDNCTIQFENGLKLYNLTHSNIKKGQVKNPYHPSVYNRGYFGCGPYISRNGKQKSKVYTIWFNMFQRCYSEKSHLVRPTYKDCEIDMEWWNFQTFAHFYYQNYIEGFQLDKDILSNSKIYGPKTCIFVPRDINQLVNTKNLTKDRIVEVLTNWKSKIPKEIYQKLCNSLLIND